MRFMSCLVFALASSRFQLAEGIRACVELPEVVGRKHCAGKGGLKSVKLLVRLRELVWQALRHLGMTTRDRMCNAAAVFLHHCRGRLLLRKTSCQRVCCRGEVSAMGADWPGSVFLFNAHLAKLQWRIRSDNLAPTPNPSMCSCVFSVPASSFDSDRTHSESFGLRLGLLWL